MDLHLTQDPDADALLSTDPFALLIGMLLDQQVPMETAFAGPKKLRDRLGGLDPGEIAVMDPAQFKEVMATPPAVHRFPGSMAGRIQSLAQVVAEEYDGDAAAIWTRGNPDGRQVRGRLNELPGFGKQKASIFLALLGKQYGFTGSGWREASGDYGDEGAYRSIADAVDPESLQRVRDTKKAAKAAAKQG